MLVDLGQGQAEGKSQDRKGKGKGKQEVNTYDSIVVGDVHRDFGALNQLINQRKPKILLQCGDFGYWPTQDVPNRSGEIPSPKAGDCRVYWCDGNHEDHWRLKERKTNELWPNVFYQPRGSTITLPDGRVVLFMGGADSIDKGVRTFGLDWFPDEVIYYDDVAKLDPNMRVDIVISHTCPCELTPFMLRTTIVSHDADPSRHALSRVFEMYRPSLWYYGHWHEYKVMFIRGCRFCALDYPGNGGRWWIPLTSK